MTTYQEVLELAQVEMADCGVITSLYDEKKDWGFNCWKPEFVENGLRVFNFCIRWSDTPDRRHIVTYGPVAIGEGKMRIYDTNAYQCWAS